ncbi:MAG TPA: hypothetical protein VEU33_08365 [Archangium sp.]|nr:hypothetical protein [Archangium sp.]
MAEQHRSPGVGEGGGAQFKARRSSRGSPWLASPALALVFLGLQAACATSYPMGGTLTGTRSWRRAGGAQEAAAAEPGASGEDLVLANLRRAAKLP